MRKPRVTGWVVVGVVLLAVVVPGLLPATDDDFRDVVVAGVQDAGSAADTARLVAEADLADRVTGPYRVAVFGDARERASDAARTVLESEVPGAEGATLRDRVVPLLTEAVGAITDAERAADDGDDGVLRSTVGRLERVARGLREVGA